MLRPIKGISLWALCIFLLVFSGCGSKQTEPAIPKTGAPVTGVPKAPPTPIALPVLKVGTEAVYAPFEFIDEKTNELVGFDVEFISAVAKEAGMKVEFTQINENSLYSSLNTGKVDLVISALTIKEERQKEAGFSDPYFAVDQVIAVKNGAPYKNLESLTGKMVGVQGNSTSQYVLENAPGFKKDNIRPYSTIQEALTDLVYGEVEAVVGDAPSILYFMQTDNDANIDTYNDNLQKEYYGIAVKKDNSQLLIKINGAIKKVKDTGKYDEIYKKYFGN